MKTIVVGGVAAGASAAARLRRLDESMEIILLERGRYISYANCGLPYHLGEVIPNRDSLFVMKESKFKSWFNVDVRTENEAVSIDRVNRTVRVRKADGEEYTEKYDKLLLATGARPADLAIPGIKDPRIHSLWTVPDMDSLSELVHKGAKRAMVVGGGFVGLEAAENLKGLGIEVTVLQHSTHVLPSLDREMAYILSEELASSGIDVRLNSEVKSFSSRGQELLAVLSDGTEISTDLVVMSVGVKPNSELASSAGLEIGPRGHIIVDEYLRTSDADIYAAGDVVEVVDMVAGIKTAIPLAGPANKQGRIAADNICGGASKYSGSYGSSVIKIGGLTAASTGLTEARVKQLGLKYHRVYSHPVSNASYYPGGAQLHMKLLFGEDGVILGAQIVGRKGVDKRLDVIGTAMQSGLRAPDLARLELAYAPPYSSAKDPVNFLGMISENILSGKTDPAYADSIPDDAVVVDVREPAERELGFIPGSINIPLGQLRARCGELDKSKEIIASCQVGLRGYLAERILKQLGYRARNLSGGYLTWKYMNSEVQLPVRPVKHENAENAQTMPAAAHSVDVRALACPGPVVRIKSEMESLKSGERLKVTAAESFGPDLEAWARSSGNVIENIEVLEDRLEAVVRKEDVTGIAAGAQSDSAAIVLFSNDMDKVMAAFIIACGMAAAGKKTGIFFTFWGLSVLRRNPVPESGEKDAVSKAFGLLLPKGVDGLSLSKFNMFGIGPRIMKEVMHKKNTASLHDLIRQARDLGVKFVACEMAMDILGIRREELIDDVDEVAGVASFVAMADSGNALFI